MDEVQLPEGYRDTATTLSSQESLVFLLYVSIFLKDIVNVGPFKRQGSIQNPHANQVNKLLLYT